MIELGVNIDHVATLRQARRTYEPDPVWAAVEAHLGGADGITVHLREDRRHIQDEDVRRLRELVHIKLNLEMAATAEMVDIAVRLKPEMAMLVPEGRHEITTEGGLDVAAQEATPGRGRPAAGRRRHRRERLHRRRPAAGRGRGAHRRKGLRDPHGTLRARVPREGARSRKRAGRRRAGEDPRGGRGDTACRDALQCRARAQLFQRAAGRRAARRARAPHRPRDRLARGLRRHARGGAADEGADPRGGRRRSQP